MKDDKPDGSLRQERPVLLPGKLARLFGFARKPACQQDFMQSCYHVSLLTCQHDSSCIIDISVW
jgi:hypothetical protein